MTHGANMASKIKVLSTNLAVIQALCCLLIVVSMTEAARGPAGDLLDVNRL